MTDKNVKANTGFFISICDKVKALSKPPIDNDVDDEEIYRVKIKGGYIQVLVANKHHTLTIHDYDGSESGRVCRRTPRNERDVNGSLFRNEKILLDLVQKKLEEYEGTSVN